MKLPSKTLGTKRYYQPFRNNNVLFIIFSVLLIGIAIGQLYCYSGYHITGMIHTREYTLRSEPQTVIQNLYVKAGDTVKPGDTLFTYRRDSRSKQDGDHGQLSQVGDPGSRNYHQLNEKIQLAKLSLFDHLQRLKLLQEKLKITKRQVISGNRNTIYLQSLERSIEEAEGEIALINIQIKTLASLLERTGDNSNNMDFYQFADYPGIVKEVSAQKGFVEIQRLDAFVVRTHLSLEHFHLIDRTEDVKITFPGQNTHKGIILDQAIIDNGLRKGLYIAGSADDEMVLEIELEENVFSTGNHKVGEKVKVLLPKLCFWKAS